MNIVIAGGSGFIGEALATRFLERGDDVVVLSRSPKRVRVGRGLEWDPSKPGGWRDVVGRADAIVNLAGESIAGGRWTYSRQEALIASRLTTTRAITSALYGHHSRHATLINASAVGIYGDRGDTVIDETTPAGTDFLARLATGWEKEALVAQSYARVVILRIGLVLSPRGGLLKTMIPPFKAGLGGRLGSGQQWMSWIDLSDLVSLIEWAMDERDVHGIHNATAPEPVRNVEFTRELAAALRRPAAVAAPRPLMRLILGREMADALLFSSQRALPQRALEAGFEFHSPRLAGSVALASLRQRA